MNRPYAVSSLPPEQIAELSRLMTEEVNEAAVFFMDVEGIITSWNRGAEDMKGFTADDAIGSHLSLLYTDEDKALGWAERNLQDAARTGFFREERWRQRKDGSLFWARILLTALRSESGELLGFSKITLDLTDHKLLESCVKEKEETRRVLRAASAGMWTWHPDTAQINLCENHLALRGYAGHDTEMPFAQWVDSVHLDQRAFVTEEFEQARAACPEKSLHLEMQLRQKDGRFRWFSVRADWFLEKAGDPYVLQGVTIDIQELKTVGEERQGAIDLLKAQDNRKDEFLAMLAHELRNPLAPIGAGAELLQMVELNEHRVRQTCEIISRQVGHMTSLIDDLLDVSRVTRGLIKLDNAALDIRRVVSDAVEQANPLIHSKHHHLTLHLPPYMVMVQGDEKRLVQIVSNLLNNAAKYTPEGGNIALKIQVKKSLVVLEVTDDGMGMDQELVNRVFDLFTQAQRASDRSSGGLGLGLALVKSLAELHGGTVAATSKGIRKGSTFTIFLPRMPETPLESGKSDVAGTLAVSSQALKILVVDDNEDAAAMLSSLLEACGHQVFVEHGARRALERAHIELPDVCVLDIGLPEMDGHELARRLRAQPANADTLLIAVTGYGQENDRKNALAAGFSHHLTKPVDTKKLNSILAEIIASQ